MFLFFSLLVYIEMIMLNVLMSPFLYLYFYSTLVSSITSKHHIQKGCGKRSNL